MSDDAARAQTTANRITSGIGCTVLAYFLFSFHDASIKWLTTSTAVVQILFTRSIVILLICLAIGRTAIVRRAIETPVRTALLLRAGVILAAWLTYYTAARDLQLAELITIYFGSPVLVMLLAVPILREKVTTWRWISAGIGFAGVVIACNPVGIGFSGPVIMALIAAFLWALAYVLIRLIALFESSLLQMFYGASTFLVATGLAMPFVWQTPTPHELAINVGIGIFATAAQYFMFEGIRRAPASVLAPFEYTSLIWAFVLGLVIWGDVPRTAVFVGAGLILLGGIVMLVSERKPAA
jgi:drug/metabolite transporter (DMT)-like permease